MSRPVPTPQPDLTSRLLAAVAERDPGLASRLGQQWVHRRGLSALERFLLTVLAPSQGLEAAEWLRVQLGLIAAPTPVVGAASRQAAAQLVIQPNMMEQVEIDEHELAALETNMAASPEPEELVEREHEESPAGRPASLFLRMKVLLRQCLEEAIVGIDRDEASGQLKSVTSALPGKASADVTDFLAESLAVQPEHIAQSAVGVQLEAATASPSCTERDVAVQPVAITELNAPSSPAGHLHHFASVPTLLATSSPAPAPPSLAALRAWLPDPEEDGPDLPRAC